jgi:hypothetical protein
MPRQIKGLPWPDKATTIMAFLTASAFFLIFISFMSVPTKESNENIIYGHLNTSQITELHNKTYLRVYYSEFCPACANQLPVLVEIAENGTIIEMLEVSRETEATERDSVMVTPTIFIINGPNYVRIDGFASLEEIGSATEKVRDKSNHMEDSYGSQSN